MSATGDAEVTYVKAINLALQAAMESDERVLLIGEDIGRGGAFRATAGLLDQFGPRRVRDTPISEGAFTGVAVGLALEGLRPIIEYQFSDFLSNGMTQITNVAATMHFRSQHSVPLVIRAPAGGGFSGGPFHSQCPEAWFLRCPGLKVVCPSTVEDVGPAMAAAVNDPNPVMFFEQKNLYTRVKGTFGYPSTAEFGGVAVRRAGDDVTCVTYGAATHLVAEAAEQAFAAGISVEVLDMRTLCPIDWTTILESVARTGRCLIVHEDHADFGVGAEVAAQLAERAFVDLDAPIRRVGAAFHPVPFSPILEDATLPSVSGILTAITDLAEF